MNKIQDFIDKRNIIFWSMSISPWASIATWLYLGAPPKNIEKINKYWLSNMEFVLTHTILELGVFGIAGKHLVLSITLCKKNSKKIQNLLLRGCPKPNRP